MKEKLPHRLAGISFLWSCAKTLITVILIIFLYSLVMEKEIEETVAENPIQKLNRTVDPSSVKVWSI